jgi:uncharacterized protein YegP (UPF0339 family)
MAEESPGYFKVTSHGRDGWQWELISAMGQTIATSSHLAERDTALKAVKWLRTHQIEKCPIVEAEGELIT